MPEQREDVDPIFSFEKNAFFGTCREASCRTLQCRETTSGSRWRLNQGSSAGDCRTYCFFTKNDQSHAEEHLKLGENGARRAEWPPGAEGSDYFDVVHTVARLSGHQNCLIILV